MNNAAIDLALVRDLATASNDIKEMSGYRPGMIVPEGYRFVPLEFAKPAPLPDFIQQCVTMHELPSLIEYLNAFKGEQSQVFGTKTPAGAAFSAILDYHAIDGVPFRCAHRVIFNPSYDPLFAAWNCVNLAAMTQEQFLEHLRRHGGSITSHADADLLEIASSLEFTTNGQFSSQMERVKGGRKLVWNEQIEGAATVKGKPVTLPEGLVISVPVFTGQKLRDIGVDVLYRVNNGALRITLELRRDHEIIREAVAEMIEQITTATDLKPFIGTPH